MNGSPSLGCVGKDVVELHCHGSRGVVSGVLSALSSFRNLRPADPGEFTQRAYANGKLGLVEVEALSDLIVADTSLQRRQALRQDVVEVVLDLGGVRCALLDTAGLREEEEEGVNDVEVEGMRRARMAARDAHIVVGVVDAGDYARGMEAVRDLIGGDDGASEDDDCSSPRRDNVLYVLNKLDLIDGNYASAIVDEGTGELSFGISCTTGQGVEGFLSSLTEKALSMVSNDDDGSDGSSMLAVEGAEGAVLTRARHRRHVEAASEALARFELLSEQGHMALDVAAEELRLAASELGRITGAIDVENILDVLFADFCIDKYDPGLLDTLPVMSKSELQKVALEHGGYATPYLNDTLYLHFKGYRRIENLEEYTGLKSLWLHSNGFTKLENLNKLLELRCLFLQRNCLTKVENLGGLYSLVQLDLSENQIRFVEGLSHLPNLTNLNLSNNALNDAASISHLNECKELSAVDLSKNQLAGEDIIDCLAGIAKVKSLNMAGNPAVSKVAYFRKKVIAACKSLRYLDRPVFDDERKTAEAFSKGGIDAERQTKEMLQQVKRNKDRETLMEFRAWQESVRSTPQILPRYEVAAALMETQPSENPPEVVEQLQANCVDLQATSAFEFEPVYQTKTTDVEKCKIAPTDIIPFDVPAEVTQEKVEDDIGTPHPAAGDEVATQCVQIKDKISKRQQVIRDLAWTTDMDKKLLKYAAEFDNNFGRVSSAIAGEVKHVLFDELSCYRRWSLLDKTSHDDVPQEQPVLPGTDKELAYFSNCDGQRKTIEELDIMHGSKTGTSSVVLRSLPNMDDYSEEDDDIIKRDEWFQKVKVL
ncbi:hypothetical protein ACHAW5_001840 [Stephanodiscus triporus]|uniref:Uncharacterized protein n=1 Tax=Stephanodiscus triporus TaxID=2934178 RepID=A0ABD3MLT2_9STRA